MNASKQASSSRGKAPKRSSKITPTREWEEELQGSFGVVAGMDEVGRGSLAGPVCVGLAFAPPAGIPVLPGLADSKSLFFSGVPALKLVRQAMMRSIVMELSPRFDLPDGVR